LTEERSLKVQKTQEIRIDRVKTQVLFPIFNDSENFLIPPELLIAERGDSHTPELLLLHE
jgi:hypothetical protein